MRPHTLHVAGAVTKWQRHKAQAKAPQPQLPAEAGCLGELATKLDNEGLQEDGDDNDGVEKVVACQAAEDVPAKQKQTKFFGEK